MMASDKQLLIEIQADDKGAAKVIGENATAIDRLEKSSKGASGAVVDYNKKQDRLRLSSGRSNQVLMNTGRIIQDLPYGFRGVANNIDPFVESLQRAKAETGSYKSVVGGLLGSLTGPAGIAIGISTISSIILSFGPQIAHFFGFFEDGKKKVDGAKKSIDNFASYVAKTGAKSVFDPLDIFKTKQELAALKTLKGQLQSIFDLRKQSAKLQRAVSQSQRGGLGGVAGPLDAKRLAKVNNELAFQKSIFGELSKTEEKSIQKKIDDRSATIKYNQALINTNPVLKLQAELSRQASRAIRDYNLGLNGTKNELQDLKSSYQTRINHFKSLAVLTESNKKKLAVLTEALKNVNNALGDDTGGPTGLEKKLQTLQAQRDALINQSGDLSQAQKDRLQGLGTEIDKYNNIITARKEIANYDKLRLQSLKKANAELQKAYAAILKTEQKKAEAADKPIAAGKLDTSLPGQHRLNFSDYAGAGGRLRQQLARYNDELARSNSLTQKQGENMLFQYQAADKLSQGLNQLRVEGFVQLGKTIGNVLSQDFHGNLFTGFQQALSNFMSTFGRQLIELGLGKIALDKLFAFPGGGAVAVAAGTALIALAQATKSKAQKRLNNITGGSGSTGVIGYRGFDFGRTGGAGSTQGSTAGPAFAAAGGAKGQGLLKIRILNGFGNIVAQGEEERDRSGGSNYLRGGN